MVYNYILQNLKCIDFPLLRGLALVKILALNKIQPFIVNYVEANRGINQIKNKNISQ